MPRSPFVQPTPRTPAEGTGKPVLQRADAGPGRGHSQGAGGARPGSRHRPAAARPRPSCCRCCTACRPGRRAPWRALILLPTRELAQQTLKEVERFAQFTFIKARLITGGEDFKVQGARLRKNPEIIIGTPAACSSSATPATCRCRTSRCWCWTRPTACSTWAADDVLALANACPAERQTLFSATHSGAGLNKVIAEDAARAAVLRLNQVGELNENVRQQVITADDVAHSEQLLQWLLSNETHRPSSSPTPGSPPIA